MGGGERRAKQEAEEEKQQYQFYVFFEGDKQQSAAMAMAEFGGEFAVGSSRASSHYRSDSHCKFNNSIIARHTGFCDIIILMIELHFHNTA